ncbi:MAG: aryl-sulfate sulfotransferase [Deltaproteobacteria bacterium]|nr:aryl-sulfate sulfotransferase [Deltaproteobacteria bacterium]
MREAWLVPFLSLLPPLALLSGCASKPPSPRLDGASARHYNTECKIFNQDGKVLRSYVGAQCIFFKNGDFLSTSYTDVTLYDRHMREVWRRDLATHHYAELSRDGAAVYTLSSSVRHKNRYDVLLKLDLRTGKTLAEWDLLKHLDEFIKAIGFTKSVFLKTRRMEIPEPARSYVKGRPPYEYTHFNSIREVGENEKGFFRPGQIVVSACCSGYVMVFDHELRAPIHMLRLAPDDVLHSASVTREGNLLYFRNSQDGWQTKRSTVEEYDPVQRRVVRIFDGVKGKVPFNAPIHGFVDKIGDDRYLFTANGFAYETDREGNVFWSLDGEARAGIHILMPFKKEDLSEFLRNNEG